MSADNTRPPLGCGRLLFYFIVAGSFAANLALCIALGFAMRSAEGDEAPLPETVYRGRGERQKVAIVKVEGVLMEGMIDYAMKQIEQVSKDPDASAVVLRIDSPGGTISSSEVLHRAITQMAKGTHRFDNKQPKTLVVSMGAIAASGGYYIAMPADYILAEKYCLTGSVGVYASLPNVSELAHKNGVKMELIKAGAIKASGSPFHEMTPADRFPWQEMIDHAYDQFLTVCAAGRPKLPKATWTEVLFEKEVPVRGEKGEIVYEAPDKPKMVKVQRQRADGGTFTADDALKFGLIDEVGTLDQAIEKAASLANLSSYRVVKYSRPTAFWTELVGLKVQQPLPDAKQLANALMPRGWMLMPGADLGTLFAVPQ